MFFRGKQILHSRERLGLLTLCAYGVIENRSEGIYAGRTDEDEGIVFTVQKKDELFEFLKGLQEGIPQDEFAERMKDFLDENAIEEFVDQLIQGGVLE